MQVSPGKLVGQIDYFIISRQLLPAVVTVHQVGEEPPRPHLPIRLKLSAKPREFRERVLKRAKAFPSHLPYGPHPRPPDWSTAASLEGKHGQERINSLHEFVVNGVVTELANAYDIIEEDRKLYAGIGCKPHFA